MVFLNSKLKSDLLASGYLAAFMLQYYSPVHQYQTSIHSVLNHLANALLHASVLSLVLEYSVYSTKSMPASIHILNV